MQELYTAVRQVLLFHPQTITNYVSDNSSSNAFQNPAASPISMAEAAENLINQLIRVLSEGLHEELNLWTVLETLECVPNKIANEDDDNPTKQALHRLRFSGQLIYVIKSTFIQSSPLARTRALLRLTLNQGALLAALELIARWNVAELKTFYANPNISVLCCVDGELWDSFLNACAPIAGVNISDIEAGVTKGASVVKFNMKLALPDIDNNSDVLSLTNINNSNNNNNNNNNNMVHVEQISVSKRRSRRRKKKKNNNNNKSKVAASENDIIKEEEEEEEEEEEVKEEEEFNNNNNNNNNKEEVISANKGITEYQLPAVENNEILNDDSKVNIINDVLETTDDNNNNIVNLLDRAEMLLLKRWQSIVASISAQEALLFEQADHA